MTTSLGEQPHDPVFCAQRGKPHKGPCIDPVEQRLTVREILVDYNHASSRIYDDEELDRLARVIVDKLNSYIFSDSEY